MLIKKLPKNFKLIKYIIIIILAALMVDQAQATMKSSSYIIYESVMHSFDGPSISTVSCSAAATSITITWDTDVVADSFVIYDTNNSFSSSKEQGSSNKNSTSHSVEVTGLSSDTTYYYRLRSTRVNGGVTTDSTARNCATSASAVVSTTTSSSGGGIIIIDKTDKREPIISEIQILDIKSDSATVSWLTDEEATSFIEFGEDIKYGNINGDWNYNIIHFIALNNLMPETSYNFKALSSDAWGNLGSSANMIFTTSSLLEEAIGKVEADDSEEPEKSKESVLAEASKKVIEIINNFSSQVSLNALEANLLSQYDNIEKLANLIPSPILVGEPKVEIEIDKATIYWQTDKEANSLVAIAAAEDFNQFNDEPYFQIVGDSETLRRDHQVQIFGLKPDTLYHYELRSRAAVGPIGRSGDFTFKTAAEILQITSYYSQIIDSQTVAFKWATNYEADSAVKFTPYLGNALIIDKSKIIRDNAVSAIHEIVIKDIEEGINYDIELSSQDSQRRIANQLIPLFSTGKDNLPPEISKIQINSTVFTDKEGKIQTIISWATNEPSTSQIYYQEGIHNRGVELFEKTNLKTDYTKKHFIVFTKFKPGLVYSFRVESADSAGNTSMSGLHTFITPQKKESILQLIIKIIEDIFNWTNRLF